MLVGLLTLELHLPQADSLKSKRFILKGMKDRIKNKFNVSIAEVDGNDLWQRSVLGVACVGNEAGVITRALGGVRDMILNMPSVELTNSRIEIL